MINLISDLNIISQAQDYAILGDRKVISSGLTKDEANDYSYRLKQGEIVLGSVYAPSIKNVDLRYWKATSYYPFGDAHTLIPVKFVTDMNEVTRTVKSDDNDWVFMTVGATFVSIVKLGKKRVAKVYSAAQLPDFKANFDKCGVALVCKLY